MAPEPADVAWLLPMHTQLMVLPSRWFLPLTRPLVCSAVALLAPVAAAEEAPVRPVPDAPTSMRTLTLPEALAYAREHQPAIHAALSRVATREAETAIPTGQWKPTIGITAQIYGMTANNTTATYTAPSWLDIPRIGATSTVASPSAATWAPSASTLVGAAIRQEVFDFGRIGAQRAASDALVDVEKHRADTTRLEVELGVEEAYFAVLAAKAIVRASEEAYDRAKVHRDYAKRGVDSGLRSPIDLTREEANLARFDVGRIRAEGGVVVSQAVLAAAIGSTEPAVDVVGDTPQPTDMPTLAEAIQMAQTRDPVLAQALSGLKAAEDKTRAVGALLRPDVSLTATLSGRAGGADPTTGGVPAGDGFLPSIPNWDAGLVLSWPLFDGTIAARRDASRTEETVRRDEIDAARLQDVANVRETHAQVLVARAALAAIQNEVIAARANYDQADARFRSGIGNAVELADAEAVRTDAEIQLALGEFELARARAAFGRAIAEGL